VTALPGKGSKMARASKALAELLHKQCSSHGMLQQMFQEETVRVLQVMLPI
jgi:hypothetical protein